jgi:hypothetical protein
MKIKSAGCLILLCCIPATFFGQEKTSKELKEEKKLEQLKQTETLVNSKSFVFVGGTAYPQGGRAINLTTRTNWVKFQPDLIDCDMPFFGRAYSGAGYGTNDGGLKFTGTPDEFSVTATKNKFLIKTSVKSGVDSYKLTLDVAYQGNATLTVVSSSRSTISYRGIITAPQPAESR